MKYFIAIPTFNGGALWENVAKAIREYAPQDTLVQSLILVVRIKQLIMPKNMGLS